MTAARDIGTGEFRAGRRLSAASISNAFKMRLSWLAGNNLEALQQRRGLSTAVPLDNDVHALPELGTRRLQHLVGLADTDKNFQTPGTIIFFAPGLGREGFR